MLVETLEQLRALYGEAGERAQRKNIGRIDGHIRRFIALSPFLVISSADAQHRMDASPRGGEPGFVKVLDDQHLLIPDASGNNRLDTLQNIIATQQVGLLFMVPGVDETLRINGRAQLTQAAQMLAHFSEERRPPRLVIQVEVQDAYLHCAKAFMRSQLWSPQARVPRSALPTMNEMIKDHARLDGPVESQEAMVQRYRETL